MTYTKQVDENGRTIRIFRTVDGAEIPIDGNLQDFCDFLTWDTHQADSLDVTIAGRQPGYFFAELDALVNHCKENGVMLFVGANDADDVRNQLRLGSKVLSERLPTPRWNRISRAVASEVGIEPLVGDDPVFVTERVCGQLRDAVMDDDSNARRVSSWPVERCFVYIDISDFSTYPPGQQALIIQSLIAIIRNRSYWNYMIAAEVREALESSICIGDGYIFVFKDATDATYFAAYLAVTIERLVAKRRVPVVFHFRMGVHVGPVYQFWDWGRSDWNYIGAGINGGQRVLSAIGKDTDDAVFVSGNIREHLTKAGDPMDEPMAAMRRSLQNRGRRLDKHGNAWRVYELNHEAAIQNRLSGTLS